MTTNVHGSNTSIGISITSDIQFMSNQFVRRWTGTSPEFRKTHVCVYLYIAFRTWKINSDIDLKLLCCRNEEFDLFSSSIWKTNEISEWEDICFFFFC